MSDFRLALRSRRPMLIDGALGTMLQSRGLGAGEAPEHFALARPEVVQGIHADYIRAGADVILTCSFGGSRFKLPKDIQETLGVEGFNRRMAENALAARRDSAGENGGRDIFILGDLGPCGHFVQPLGELDPQELYAATREQVRGLVDGGVDGLFIETQFDLAEARIMVAAVRAETALPLMVSMTFENGLSLTGSDPETFLATMRNMGVDAVGLNCGAGPEEMSPLVDRLLACSDLPLVVEPNAGLPELIDGETCFRLPPQPFAEQTAEFMRRGVQLLGGCCGTTPEHIAALRRAVDNIQPADMGNKPLGITLTSRSRLVRITQGEPLCVIGERINPTGKKELQETLRMGSCTAALRLAKEQLALGVPVLDVNVGAPLVDEAVMLPKLVRSLVERFQEPLALDSSNTTAIAAALPWYPGSALINSISGEGGRDGQPAPFEVLGPLCKQWGSPFILLPLQGKRLPLLASERIAIIESLLLKAEQMGIARHLIMVDALALSVGSNAEAGRECLATLRWCAAQGLPTVLGLSNISFGLPARDLLNTTFLSMAMGAGLTACIANPSSQRLTEARMAGDVLLGQDPGTERFVGSFASWSPATPSERQIQHTQSLKATTVAEAVLCGDRDAVEELVDKELAEGIEPFALVNQRMIPAITNVGERYERSEIFLPQLLRSAETMRAAFERVKPLLEAAGQSESRPVIVLATVEGDIHDIGKNIVALMLGNAGYELIDLGKDVRAETIVDAATEHKAALIGLSALMTTTMVRMEDTVTLLAERGLSIPVMVGGAVLTDGFAKSIGAHYSADAVGAVKLANTLLA